MALCAGKPSWSRGPVTGLTGVTGAGPQRGSGCPECSRSEVGSESLTDDVQFLPSSLLRCVNPSVCVCVCICAGLVSLWGSGGGGGGICWSEMPSSDQPDPKYAALGAR